MDVITFPVNLLTTSGLSILLHGVISLPDATVYDKLQLSCYNTNIFWHFSLREQDKIHAQLR